MTHSTAMEQRVEQAIETRDTEQLQQLLLEHLLDEAIEQDNHRDAATLKVASVLDGSCLNWKHVFFEPDGRVNWDAVAEFNRRWSRQLFTQGVST